MSVRGFRDHFDLDFDRVAKFVSITDIGLIILPNNIAVGLESHVNVPVVRVLIDSDVATLLPIPGIRGKHSVIYESKSWTTALNAYRKCTSNVLCMCNAGRNRSLLIASMMSKTWNPKSWCIDEEHYIDVIRGRFCRSWQLELTSCAGTTPLYITLWNWCFKNSAIDLTREFINIIT